MPTLTKNSRVLLFVLAVLAIPLIALGAAIAPALAVFLLIVGLYFLPTVCALVRHKRNPGGVIVVNVLLGWTFVGWVVALAWAFSGSTTNDVGLEEILRSANPAAELAAHIKGPEKNRG